MSDEYTFTKYEGEFTCVEFSGTASPLLVQGRAKLFVNTELKTATLWWETDEEGSVKLPWKPDQQAATGKWREGKHLSGTVNFVVYRHGERLFLVGAYTTDGAATGTGRGEWFVKLDPES